MTDHENVFELDVYYDRDRCGAVRLTSDVGGGRRTAIGSAAV